MRSTHFAALCLLIAACGDDNTKLTPDARVFPDTAPPDIDAAPVACSFTEAADATNDDLFGGGTPELSGQTFTANSITFCGQINNGHFNTTETAVDVDSFRFTVPTATIGILYIKADGAENLDSVSVEISGITTPTGVSEVAVMNGDYGVVAATMPAGDYLVTISAYNAADATAAISYRATLNVDSATRCAKATAVANFTEAGDTALASGNDVIQVDYSASTQNSLTVLSTDAAEATGITVGTGSYRITGTNTDPAADPVSWGDDYQDRDTYLITMGATQDTLAVRTNWPGTTMDFDFFVFPKDSTDNIAVGWDNANMEDEFTTFAVTPGAQYWVWVAADDASTGQPVTYDVTLCGSSYNEGTGTAMKLVPDRIRRHPVFQRRGVRPVSKK